MIMRRILFAFALLTFVAHGAAAQQRMTWKVEKDTREALVYAPKSPAAGAKLPLVLSFHGHGDDMENFQYVDLQRSWPDAVVVYFQGLQSRDGARGWQVEKGEYNDRDLKLVDMALAALKAKYPIDEGRIYATGFSNGAHFTYLLWAERPDVFAAFAPVAGRIRPSEIPKHPRPLLHIGGAADAQVAFADQKAAIVTAVGVNGVRGQESPCGPGCTVYGKNSPNPVMTWIHQGGHEYPRGTSERIVQFFHDHARGD
jgi:polyhydroxybutyrate depolymerase